ncbi:L,D-transpeptidase family protein [Mangrovicoccus algicola]|uniref:L,D-transpeptidase family protein n=1 Tax=Mangrovicoccus algicola TaxID=2771008 RepID=A0A8J7CHJ7_9RHOB|nr:L,D-transpeptidase family protein [Mangrovicoccus algicola]MBE3638250.1 L,D-transpeptidase family protein [Mangrovicoccus algicola]
MVRVLSLVLFLALSACGGGSKFQSYDGPEVTQIYISKERRKLYLLHEAQVIKSYDIGLGFNPVGHKVARGDGRTPEGLYLIDRRNPNSAYHLSLGISYPNRADTERSKTLGVDPGGDIFIHGESSKPMNGKDWTAGCIAVTDKEMEEIFAMVKTGTPIYITSY